MNSMSNLASVVYKRTYARNDNGMVENWSQTVERVIAGNVRGLNVSDQEIQRLRYFLSERKAGPAGRGWWFSGAKAQDVVGGAALTNCWFQCADNWMNFVDAQDLLMLGGGVGLSVEHKYVSKLPRVKKGVVIRHKATKDASFIVPDSREGWCELLRRVLESFFVTGRSFDYSTVCIRGYGEKINGFGGTASGPLPLIALVEKLCALLGRREGKTVRPVDAMDIICCIGEMVVAGNVRRSAILVLGDCWDKEYLKAKRWDLGPIPTQRAMANLSVVADDIEDVHPLFWKTYENGEPFGIVNRANIQKFARMGDLQPDTAVGTNPCAEACLEDGEPCNLQDIALPRLTGVDEFVEASRLMHRWGKRVTMAPYHLEKSDEVVKRNRRVGTGITGCLQSPLFSPEILDVAYRAIQDENVSYSKELGIPKSIRTTTIKPSGTVSKMYDMKGYEGIHAAWSRYYIQRIRFSATDPMIPLLAAAGHHIEPVVRFDGTFDHNTVVVDFYEQAPDGAPVADEGWDTWKQLDVLKMAQKHWADQSISVTVYYKKEELNQLKAWLGENLKYIKTISFLCHSDHGFKQAPKEAISKEMFEKLAPKVKPIKVDGIGAGDELGDSECAGGACPIK